MSCAHTFDQWCAECIDGLVQQYNQLRKELAAREVIIETYEAQLTVHQRRAEQAEARVVELLATLRSLQEIPAPEFWAVYDTLRDIQTKAQHVSLFVDKIANLIPDPKAEP